MVGKTKSSLLCGGQRETELKLRIGLSYQAGRRHRRSGGVRIPFERSLGFGAPCASDAKNSTV